jgi:CRISPR system Cascade subunit CasE
MSLFPEDLGEQARASAGVLFRIEDTPAGAHVLLQSCHKPDTARLPDGYGTALSRPLNPLLDALRPGLTVRYRCVASPVRKPGESTRALYRLPPVVALTGASADQWWARQAEAAGLTCLDVHSQPVVAVAGPRARKGPRSDQHVRHARTQFDGSATITDPDLLRSKIIHGIGRGKSYGCGLLSIAPGRGVS